MATRPLSKRNSPNSSKRHREIWAHFDICPSANTATSQAGRTITWPYFRKMMSRHMQLPEHGRMVSSALRSSIRREHGISLAIRPRKWSERTTTDFRLDKNQNSKLRHPESEVSPYLISLPAIRAQLVRKYSKREVTLNELCDSADECIRSISISSPKYGSRSEYLCSTGIDSVMKDITSIIKPRRQHGNHKRR